MAFGDLSDFAKKLNITEKAIPKGKEYATPDTPLMSIREDSDGNSWAVFAVALNDAQAVLSATGNSLTLAAFNLRPTDTDIGDTAVTLGVSRGKLWMKPRATTRKPAAFPTFK